MISNSTPLICLAKINQIALLKKLFKEIIIPSSVAEEVLIEGKPGYATIEKAIEEAWIKIINPKNNQNLGLDKGENAAINLAKEKKDTIIIDDAFGIKVANSLNINYIRTTSIILMSLKKKLINKNQAISCIDNLVSIGYFLSPKIYVELMKIIESF